MALLDALIVRNIEAIGVFAERTRLRDLNHAAIVVVVVASEAADREIAALVFPIIAVERSEFCAIAALVDGLRTHVPTAGTEATETTTAIPIVRAGNLKTSRAIIVRLISRLARLRFMADRPGKTGLLHRRDQLFHRRNAICHALP